MYNEENSTRRQETESVDGHWRRLMATKCECGVVEERQAREKVGSKYLRLIKSNSFTRLNLRDELRARQAANPCPVLKWFSAPATASDLHSHTHAPTGTPGSRWS